MEGLHDMCNFEEDAKKHENKAKSEMKKKHWFDGGNKYEEAVEYYEKAGNCYKACKQYERAYQMYMNASQCYENLKDINGRASSIVEASNCIVYSDMGIYIELIGQACKLYVELGRYSIVGKLYYEAGEKNESSPIDALELYLRSSHYYRTAEQVATANKSEVKCADIYIILNKCKEAVEMYDKLIKDCIDGPTKYSAGTFIFKAMLSHMILETTRMCISIDEQCNELENILDEYATMSSYFDDSREHRFLKKVLESWKNSSVEEFEEAVKEYDNITKLSTLITSMLLIIKQYIEVGPKIDMR